MTRFCFGLFFCCLVTVLTSPCLARFQVQDSLKLDPVDSTSPEHYNDILSYRYPLSWQEIWQSAANGFRASAGSLDIRRFSYLQEVKLESSRERAVVLGYRSQTVDTDIQQSTLQEIRVTHQVLANQFAVSLLGDSGYEKEYGDIGFELWLSPSPRWQGTYRFWAVDLYYQTKKLFPEDSRIHETFEHGLELQWREEGAGHAKIEVRYNTPLLWDLASQGYRYGSRESHFSFSGRKYLTEASSRAKSWVDLSVSLGDKQESFERLSETMNPFFSRIFPKELAPDLPRDGKLEVSQSNKVKVVDVSFNTLEPAGKSLSVGGWHLSSKANRKKETSTGSDRSALTRSESALWSFLSLKDIGHPDRVWHHGLVVNSQVNNYLWETSTVESKFVLALEFVLGKDSRIFVNSTWDIDQMADDAPYSKRPFRPWGGGNLQGMLAF